LRTAHVHNKGAFYSALFNLSNGLERALKVVVIIDQMLSHALAAPTKGDLKRRGHALLELIDEWERVAAARNWTIIGRNRLDPIDQKLLGLLNDFAKVTRYHNLDALSRGQSGPDPLKTWNEVLVSVLQSEATDREKHKVLSEATLASTIIESGTITIMHGLDQTPLSTFDALALPGLHQCAVRYVIFRFLRILTRIRSLLSDASHESYRLGVPMPAFPQMQEFLEWVWDDRRDALKRKRWP